jgi:hypothetical protein
VIDGTGEFGLAALELQFRANEVQLADAFGVPIARGATFDSTMSN